MVFVTYLLTSLAPAQAGADAADEVEQPEALGRLVRLALGDGQRVARAVEVAEGAAQPARVALPPVDDVEACRVRQLAQQSGVVASEWTLLDANEPDAEAHRLRGAARRE